MKAFKTALCAQDFLPASQQAMKLVNEGKTKSCMTAIRAHVMEHCAGSRRIMETFHSDENIIISSEKEDISRKLLLRLVWLCCVTRRMEMKSVVEASETRVLHTQHTVKPNRDGSNEESLAFALTLEGAGRLAALIRLYKRALNQKNVLHSTTLAAVLTWYYVNPEYKSAWKAYVDHWQGHLDVQESCIRRKLLPKRMRKRAIGDVWSSVICACEGKACEGVVCELAKKGDDTSLMFATLIVTLQGDDAAHITVNIPQEVEDVFAGRPAKAPAKVGCEGQDARIFSQWLAEHAEWRRRLPKKIMPESVPNE